MAEYNNPGNIRPGQKYAGETGKFYAARDGSKYVIFDSKEMGLRALFIDLKSKINQFDGDVEKIISKYAPSSDANPTKNYIDFVKSNVGKDIVTEQDLPKLVSAVIKFENKPKTASKYLKPDLLQTAMQLSSVNMPQKTTLAEAKEIVGIESKAPKQQNTSNEQETILSTVRPATDARAKRVQKLIDASEEPLNIIEERQQSNIPTKQIADKTLNIIETRQKSDGSIDDSDSVAILEQRQNVVASQPDETELSLLERQTKPIERQAKPIEKNVNGFLYGKPDPLNFLPNQAIDKPLGTFTENISAAYRASRATDQSVSEGTMLRDEWQPIIDEINEKTGSSYFNPADHLRAGLFSAPATQGDGERKYQYSTQKIFKHIQDNSDVLPDLQTITHEQLLKQAQQQALANRENFGEVTHRSPGASNVIARFLGSMGGIATDPVVYESMGFAGASKTLYGAMFREAAIGAGTEAVAQAGVKEWYESLGLDYTYQQFWQAIAFGGVFGAGTPLAFRIGGKTIRATGKTISLTADQVKKGYQALVGSGAARETGTTRAARATAEAADDAVAANPLGPAPDAPEQIIVYAPNGQPQVATVVARSESGSIIVKLADGKETVVGDEGIISSSVYDPNFKIESIEGTPLVKNLSDDEIIAVIETLDRKINTPGQTQSAMTSFVSQRNALRIEQKRRAGEDVTTPDDPIISSRQDAEIAHDARVMDADRAVENNVPPSMPDVPPATVRPPESVYDADNLDGVIFRFNAKDIEVDAKTFQFKEGGDEFGVTKRLQGVKTWNPYLSGTVTVYEYANGSRFIADGHQRLGLAKRIMAQDPSQDVRLHGYLFREIDGIDPEVARAFAAIKNISEGTGTAIDATKVLRDAPERFEDLPPNSVLVRQARALVNLSDEGFGVVINGVVPPNYAALVGRLIPDDEGLQLNALSVLSKTDPANEFQAEAIVRQVRDAGAEKVTQIGLFGEEVITESFFAERARILDRAQKILRQDKNAFKSLVDNASRLEAEGNQLAKQANQRRADNDTQAIALLQALANRKGDLSDALTAAAKQARDTGSYAEPSRSFVEAIRRSIESGDFDRISTGDVGQPVNVAAESRSGTQEAERVVDEFDQPGGEGVINQANQLQDDIFGAVDPEPQPVREVKIPEDRIIRLKDLDVVEAKAIETQARINQAFQSVDDLMDRGARNHDDLTAQIKTVAESVGAKQKVAPLKLRKRVEEKIRDKYEGDLNLVTDVARGGIEAETNEIADAFVEAISQRYKVIDEGYIFTAEGYFDRKLAVIFDDGQIGEIQIWSPGMLEAKNSRGHDLYKISRDLKQPKEAREKAVADMQQLYGDVAANLSDSWKAILARQIPSGIDAPSRAATEATTARVTSGDPSSPITSEASIRDQLPVSDNDTILPLDISMVGIKSSTRKNLIGASSDNIDIANQNVKVDLDEEIPVSLRVDPETNEVIAQTMTLRQIQDDISQDVKMLDRLRGCVK